LSFLHIFGYGGKVTTFILKRQRFRMKRKRLVMAENWMEVFIAVGHGKFNPLVLTVRECLKRENNGKTLRATCATASLATPLRH